MTAAASTQARATQVDMLHVRGTPYEQGYQQGLEKKTEIRATLRRIADLTDGDWGELPLPPEARTNPERFFTPRNSKSCAGWRPRSKCRLGNLAALNLAVLNDFAANATQVALVSHAGDATHVLHGLASELSLPPALVEMLTPLVLVREPAQGWACATVTFAGDHRQPGRAERQRPGRFDRRGGQRASAQNGSDRQPPRPFASTACCKPAEPWTGPPIDCETRIDRAAGPPA